jgi:hypothetical protein
MMMQTGKDVNYQIKSIIGIQVFKGIYFQKNLICMQEIPHGKSHLKEHVMLKVPSYYLSIKTDKAHYSK